MNYARRQPPRPEPGTVFEGVNFSQEKAGTVLVNLAGVPVTFRCCNLVNVAVDEAWTVKNCNTTQADLPPPPTERELKEFELQQRRADKTEAEADIARLERELDILPAPIGP